MRLATSYGLQFEIEKRVYEAGRVFSLDVGLIDAELAIVVPPHRVAEAGRRDEGRVLLAARDLQDRDVIGAEARKVVQGFAGGHLRAKPQLAVAIRAPREHLSELLLL